MQNKAVGGKVVYVEKVVHINLVFIRPQNMLEPKWNKQSLPLLPSSEGWPYSPHKQQEETRCYDNERVFPQPLIPQAPLSSFPPVSVAAQSRTSKEGLGLK